VAALALVPLSFFATAAFGGQAPLGPHDNVRHESAPYNLAKLNYLGLNYCENLLDKRVNLTSYTHLGYDAVDSPLAGHIQAAMVLLCELAQARESFRSVACPSTTALVWPGHPAARPE
jgi:hypothetical protein